jgi:ATP-dependent protease HslVU (ClpYQ) peptidase subunit
MTTIIGIEVEKGAQILADSQVTDDSGKMFSHSSMTKINHRGAFVIAGAGEILPCDVIQHIWEPPRLLAKDKHDLYHFMVVKVIPSMRKCLKENGYNFDDQGSERFQFLVAVSGELFELDEDLGITKSDSGHYAIGSGAPYALGALAMGADVFEAMEVAAKLTAFTAPPYIRAFQYK